MESHHKKTPPSILRGQTSKGRNGRHSFNIGSSSNSQGQYNNGGNGHSFNIGSSSNSQGQNNNGGNGHSFNIGSSSNSRGQTSDVFLNGQNNKDGDDRRAITLAEDRLRFPPGVRFCPHDAELFQSYLLKKLKKQELAANRIQEVCVYDYNPEELAGMYKDYGENEWYFFTPRTRKYRNGKRPNRAAGTGFWKATGADRKTHFENGMVGLKKTLVFYRGKASGDNKKTNWIMHEYKIETEPRIRTSPDDMMLDDCVLCRIYEKAERPRKTGNQANNAPLQIEEPAVESGNNINSIAVNESDDNFEMHIDQNIANDSVGVDNDLLVNGESNSDLEMRYDHNAANDHSTGIMYNSIPTPYYRMHYGHNAVMNSSMQNWAIGTEFAAPLEMHNGHNAMMNSSMVGMQNSGVGTQSAAPLEMHNGHNAMMNSSMVVMQNSAVGTEYATPLEMHNGHNALMNSSMVEMQNSAVGTESAAPLEMHNGHNAMMNSSMVRNSAVCTEYAAPLEMHNGYNAMMNSSMVVMQNSAVGIESAAPLEMHNGHNAMMNSSMAVMQNSEVGTESAAPHEMHNGHSAMMNVCMPYNPNANANAGNNSMGAMNNSDAANESFAWHRNSSMLEYSIGLMNTNTQYSLGQCLLPLRESPGFSTNYNQHYHENMDYMSNNQIHIAEHGLHEHRV